MLGLICLASALQIYDKLYYDTLCIDVKGRSILNALLAFSLIYVDRPLNRV
jgi:hypothetical protein